jgi:hypothetical protein
MWFYTKIVLTYASVKIKNVEKMYVIIVIIIAIVAGTSLAKSVCREFFISTQNRHRKKKKKGCDSSKELPYPSIMKGQNLFIGLHDPLVRGIRKRKR